MDSTAGVRMKALTMSGSTSSVCTCKKGRYKATWKRDFKLPWHKACLPARNVDIRLPGKGIPNCHGARPVF